MSVSLQPVVYCPGQERQFAFVHLAAPALLMKPDAQSRQAGEPAGAYLLISHCVHVDTDIAPTALLAVPAEQFLQVPGLLPPQLSRYVPATQVDVHTVQLIALAAL